MIARLLPRRLRRDRVALPGLALVLLVVVRALAAPWLAPHDPAFQFSEGLTVEGTLRPPDHQALLGTDLLGRDVLSRLIWGARASLLVGVLANGLAVAIGVLVGAAEFVDPIHQIGDERLWVKK